MDIGREVEQLKHASFSVREEVMDQGQQLSSRLAEAEAAIGTIKARQSYDGSSGEVGILREEVSDLQALVGPTQRCLFHC